MRDVQWRECPPNHDFARGLRLNFHHAGPQQAGSRFQAGTLRFFLLRVQRQSGRQLRERIWQLLNVAWRSANSGALLAKEPIETTETIRQQTTRRILR